MIADKTVSLDGRDRMFTMLVEFGVSEKWLVEANLNTREITDLLRGVLYLREMHPEQFKDQ